MLTISERKELKYCERRIKQLQNQKCFDLKAITRDEVEMLQEMYRDIINYILSER